MASMGRAKSKNLKAGLIILGAGGAGLAAAVEAAEKGAGNIIVVEKRNKLGGNTALAGGLFACESPVQTRQKIIADKDFFFKKAVEWAHWDRINPEILRAFINKSGDTIRWLEAKGLEFDLIRLYPDQNPPVQHNPKGNGARLIRVLSRICKEFDVSIMPDTSAKRILRSENGKIRGVVVINNNEEIEVSAESVIIATGGFGGNTELLKKYCPSYYDGMPRSGLPLTGDGLALAAEAGAVIEHSATMIKEGPRFDLHTWPLMTFERDPSTLWVNKKGKRFIDEAAGYRVFESVNAMLGQPGRISYALFDASIRKRFEERMPALENTLRAEAEKGKVMISDSWDDIAEWIGAGPEALKNTVTQYNSYCGQGYDESYAKERRYLLPLILAPYYAVRGLAVLLDTIGGIRINERMEVLDDYDNPIPGLYAAGVTAGGWESEIYCSDLSASAFGFALNSGRIAGENAVSYLSGS